MNKRRMTIMLVLLTSICFLPLYAQEIKLEFQYVAGDTSKSKEVQTVTVTGESVPGGKIVLEQTHLRQRKVLAVYPDGSADVTGKIISHLHKRNGVQEPFEDEEEKVVHIWRVSNRGQNIDVQLKPVGQPPPNFEKHLQNHKDHLQGPPHLQPIFPEKPIKMGESWTNERIESFEEGGTDVSVKVKFTLEKLEKFQGYDCVKMKFSGTLEGSAGGGHRTMEAKLNGTWYFAYKLGRTIRYTFDLKQDEVRQTNEGPQAVKTHVQYTRERLED